MARPATVPVSASLSARSERELAGVDQQLANTVRVAQTFLPFELLVVDGKRSIEEQREYVRRGSSRTMRSNHLTGRAVDLAAIIGKQVRWDRSQTIYLAMLRAATITGARIAWGGNWKSFQDTPHYELA